MEVITLAKSTCQIFRNVLPSCRCMKEKSGLDGDLNRSATVGHENGHANIPVEQRIWDWLNKNSKCIAFIVVALGVIGAIYGIGCAWNCHTVRKHLEDYSTKNSLQERLAWAEGKQPCALKNLQGFVFLENAYHCMEGNDFGKAVFYFNKAMVHLKVSPLREQATSGLAYAYLQNEQPDEAKKMFLELYKCRSKYLRAQALFALCSIATKEGNTDEFNKYKEQLQAYDEGAGFLRKLEIFESVK